MNDIEKQEYAFRFLRDLSNDNLLPAKEYGLTPQVFGRIVKSIQDDGYIRGAKFAQGGRNNPVLAVFTDAAEMTKEGRDLLMTSIQGTKTKSTNNILLLVALKKELDAILDIFSFTTPIREEDYSGTKYHIIHLSDSLKITCHSMAGDMGQLAAMNAVQCALKNFQFDGIILSGICGGINGEMKYGDLVVSEQIVNYELGKVKEDEHIYRWKVFQSSYMLLNGMKNFKSTKWVNHLQKTFKDRKDYQPQVHFGTVLSGNKVIASKKEALNLTSVWDKALAVEMEASGIAQALYYANSTIPFIMVKSVCDFADKNKNDDWQEYSANASAAYIVDFIVQNHGYLSNVNEETMKSNPTDKVERDNEDKTLNETNRLFDAITLCYNFSELNVLASQIGVNLEDIKGETRQEKVMELILFCRRKMKFSMICDKVDTDNNYIYSKGCFAK